MFFTNTNLFRNLLSNNTFKIFCCCIAVFNLLATPGFASKENPIFDAAEYEEWGLDYPGATPSESDTDAEQPVPNLTPEPSATPEPVVKSTITSGGPVPQDLGNLFEQSAVHVIVIYGEDDFAVMPGWIVDAERRIIMTFDLLKGAKQIKVAYPQDKDIPEGEISQSLAVVLEHETKMSYVFIQANTMPQAVANLSILKPTPSRPIAQRPATQRPATQQRPVVVNKPTAPTPPNNGGFNQGGGFSGGGQTNSGFNQGGGFNGGQQGGFQQPAQSQNPLVGTWFLQDTVNGTQIRIGAAFDAQGQFAIHIIAVDGYGQQSQETSEGTYRVQGNTLITNSSDGVERSNFWFENGMLYVQMQSAGTTLVFQPAS